MLKLREVTGLCPLCGGREYDNGAAEHTTLCIEHRELKERFEALERDVRRLEGAVDLPPDSTR